MRGNQKPFRLLHGHLRDMDFANIKGELKTDPHGLYLKLCIKIYWQKRFARDFEGT